MMMTEVGRVWASQTCERKLRKEGKGEEKKEVTSSGWWHPSPGGREGGREGGKEGGRNHKESSEIPFLFCWWRNSIRSWKNEERKQRNLTKSSCRRKMATLGHNLERHSRQSRKRISGSRPQSFLWSSPSSSSHGKRGGIGSGSASSGSTANFGKKNPSRIFPSFLPPSSPPPHLRRERGSVTEPPEVGRK